MDGVRSSGMLHNIAIFVCISINDLSPHFVRRSRPKIKRLSHACSIIDPGHFDITYVCDLPVWVDLLAVLEHLALVLQQALCIL